MNVSNRDFHPVLDITGDISHVWMQIRVSRGRNIDDTQLGLKKVMFMVLVIRSKKKKGACSDIIGD